MRSVEQIVWEAALHESGRRANRPPAIFTPESVAALRVTMEKVGAAYLKMAIDMSKVAENVGRAFEKAMRG